MARQTIIASGLLALAALSFGTLSYPGPAHAQRVSLADRVSALESQQAAQTGSAGQANVELLNRLTQLQSEVQALRGQVEQLQNDNAALREGSDNRYKDLDGRLQRMEATPGAAPPLSAAPPRAPSAANPPLSSGPDLVNRMPAAPSGPPAAAPAGDERASYDSAFAALRAGDYVASARGFKAYLDAFPGGALAPNAWYWLGESYYVTQNYPIALQSFDTLLQRFPDSSKAPDALLKRGFAQIELGQAGPGQQTLNRVITDYPGSDAARLAAGKLRTLQLQSH